MAIIGSQKNSLIEGVVSIAPSSHAGISDAFNFGFPLLPLRMELLTLSPAMPCVGVREQVLDHF